MTIVEIAETTLFYISKAQGFKFLHIFADIVIFCFFFFFNFFYYFSSVAQSCPTLCNPMDCGMPGFPVHHNSLSLLRLMSIKLVMPSNHLILCHPLLLLPSIFSSIRVFSNESVLWIRWLKYWSFGISPYNEYSGSIPLGLTGLILQSKGLSRVFNYSSKASILWRSAFFVVQLSHPYMTIGKTITLTIWTFVGNVMSLLFNMLSRFVIIFLPWSKCLLAF